MISSNIKLCKINLKAHPTSQHALMLDIRVINALLGISEQKHWAGEWSIWNVDNTAQYFDRYVSYPVCTVCENPLTSLSKNHLNDFLI
jgi:hypothetical protein